MIQLNQPYSAKELAKEMEVSHKTFLNKRNLYETHLKKFYKFEITKGGRGRNGGFYYTFTHQMNEFIPYKQFRYLEKEQVIKQAIVDTISADARQTGSNIARIIRDRKDIAVLRLADSTLGVYVRLNLKDFIDDGFYTKCDTRWCYLRPDANKYQIMSDEEVAALRKLFDKHTKQEEKMFRKYQEKEISKEEAQMKIGECRLNGFLKGLGSYYDKHKVYPLLVPVYEENAFYTGKYKGFRPEGGIEVIVPENCSKIGE